MATPVNVNEPSPRRSTAATLLLAASVGLLGLAGCTQAPDGKAKDPVAKDVKLPDAKPDAKPEVTPPKDPEPMPPPAT